MHVKAVKVLYIEGAAVHSFEPEDFKCTIWDRAFISFKTDVKITERGKERQTQQVSMRGNWQRDTAEVKLHSELAAQLLTGTGWWHEYFFFIFFFSTSHTLNILMNLLTISAIALGIFTAVW